MDERTTVTRAFLFTDLESSTRRWQSEVDTMGAALEVHDRCLEESIGRVGGTIVEHTGDGVLAVFDDARSALAAAVAGQRALADADWSASAPLRARMAVDAGLAEQRGGDYFGTTLNRAARLLGVAHATQTVCSGAAVESAADTLPDGMELVDLGHHRLRDLERAVQVFQVVAPDMPTEFPPLRSLSAARHNLPVIPNSFVGRHSTIESLGTAVDDHPLVTLTGAGGAGKTRLAPGGSTTSTTRAAAPSGRGYRGRTVRETAERLSIPEGTVKSRLYHAMRALRRELERHEVLP